MASRNGMMANVRQSADPASGADAEKKTWTCAAYGCPLPGAISSSIGGRGKFFCRFHFGHDPSEFHGITAKVRSGMAEHDDAKSKEEHKRWISQGHGLFSKAPE